MQDLLTDVLHDTLSMLPFLYAAYVFMEYLEHKSNDKMQRLLAGTRRFGPLVGSVLGIVPQCGFSVIAGGLYMNGSITLGTLIAVFVSTSDEAIPILIAQPNQLDVLVQVIAVKLVIGCISGYLIDLLVKQHHLKENHPLHDIHEHCDEEQKKHPSIFAIAFLHTLKIFLFIFCVNFIISFIIHEFGEEALAQFLGAGSFLQPLFASLVGFIPNCAASVILSQLFIDGVVSFGALTAGLITSAGLGLLVLFKMYDNKKDICRILGILFIIALVTGSILQILS